MSDSTHAPSPVPGTLPIPTPAQTARDALGRLVAVTWGAGPADATGRWLVAVDGSAGSLRAVAAAVRLVRSAGHAAAAPGGGPGIDLVHVHTWLVKEAAEIELPRRGWQASADARALLEAAGIAWRLHVRMGEAAEEIVALAQSLGSLGIAIGSHGLTAAESILLGSVAYRVVHLGKVPVLILR